MLPSPSTNPEARTVDLGDYGVPCVVQLGRCRVMMTRRPAHGSHSHDCHQITLCAHGSQTFRGRRQTWTLLPGRMLVLPPGTVHRLVANTRGNLRYWLFVRLPPPGGAGMAGLPPEESGWLATRINALRGRLYRITAEAERIPEEIFRVLDDATCGAAERRIRIRTLALRFFLALAGARPAADEPDDKIRPIVARMRREPERAYPLDALVAETRLSATALTAVFRRETGKTPHQFLVACRVRKAMDALANTSASVTSLALALGFASSQHLAASFRRETGMTPRAYRERVKGERGKVKGAKALEC